MTPFLLYFFVSYTKSWYKIALVGELAELKDILYF